MHRGIFTSEFYKNLALLVAALLSLGVSFGWIPSPVAESMTGQITVAITAVGAVLGAAYSNGCYAASRARVKETQAVADAHARR